MSCESDESVVRNGVTLIEIVIGIFIIAVAFLPILGVVQYGGKSTVRINNYAIVAKIAHGLIEECRHVPISAYVNDYADLQHGQWFAVKEAYFPKTLLAIASFSDEIKSLAVAASLTVIKEPDTQRIREIWIRVHGQWKEGDGTTQGERVRNVRLANAIHRN